MSVVVTTKPGSSTTLLWMGRWNFRPTNHPGAQFRQWNRSDNRVWRPCEILLPPGHYLETNIVFALPSQWLMETSIELLNLIVAQSATNRMGG